MRIKILPRQQYKTMPWKNGLGQTAEIDRHPKGEEKFLWRFSLATISQNSRFSEFRGYDRWICVWRGQGIKLNDQTLKPNQPYHFSGDFASEAQLLNGPVEDLGLIYDRDQIEAKMEIHEGEISLKLHHPQDVYYVFDLGTGDTQLIQNETKIITKPSLLISVRNK